MQVIQTLYRNHLFRSRLEARYGVFFDALGEPWEYEKEGFDLDGGDKYLPDFYLPRLHCWIEIKGQIPTEDEIRKCRKLQFYTEQDVAIFHSLPMEYEGVLFAWDDTEGGQFTESLASWTYDDGVVGFSDYLNGGPAIKEAAALAKRIRFEHGAEPELEASRIYENIVNYDAIAF